MNDELVLPSRPRRRRPHSSGGDDRRLALLAKALGHPARVAIMRLLLRNGECVCGRIVDVLPQAQATVSQHLKVLKQAGLVKGEVEGQKVCYCANPEEVERLRDLVGKLLAGPEPTPTRRKSP